MRRRESGKYQALLYRAETLDGAQKVIGTFDTLPDAVTAREGALREAARAEQAPAISQTPVGPVRPGWRVAPAP